MTVGIPQWNSKTRLYPSSIGPAIRFITLIINKGTEIVDTPVTHSSDSATGGLAMNLFDFRCEGSSPTSRSQLSES